MVKVMEDSVSDLGNLHPELLHSNLYSCPLFSSCPPTNIGKVMELISETRETSENSRHKFDSTR